MSELFHLLHYLRPYKALPIFTALPYIRSLTVATCRSSEEGSRAYHDFYSPGPVRLFYTIIVNRVAVDESWDTWRRRTSRSPGMDRTKS